MAVQEITVQIESDLSAADFLTRAVASAPAHLKEDDQRKAFAVIQALLAGRDHDDVLAIMMPLVIDVMVSAAKTSDTPEATLEGQLNYTRNLAHEYLQAIKRHTVQ